MEPLLPFLQAKAFLEFRKGQITSSWGQLGRAPFSAVERAGLWRAVWRRPRTIRGVGAEGAYRAEGSTEHVVLWCRLQLNFNFPDTEYLDRKSLTLLYNQFTLRKRCERLIPLILNASGNVLVIFRPPPFFLVFLTLHYLVHYENVTDKKIMTWV